MLKSTERFSSRVEDYVKYRPSYPQEIIQTLTNECGMTPAWRIADIGSGPGNLSRLFLENGNAVFGVEPNKEMREAGEGQMSGYPNFFSVDGTAETTNLENESVELVTAAQAFHWFEPVTTRQEFARILKPGGWVALVWNDRKIDQNRFSSEYERILTDLAPEYPAVKHQGQAESFDSITSFFGVKVHHAQFPYSQTLGWDAFIGRVLSASYIPQRGQHGHEEIFAALRRLFDEEQRDGTVSYLYDTQVFYGQLR